MESSEESDENEASVDGFDVSQKKHFPLMMSKSLVSDISSLANTARTSAQPNSLRSSKLVIKKNAGDALKKLESILNPIEAFHDVLNELIELCKKYGGVRLILRHRKFCRRRNYYAGPLMYSLKQAFQCELLRSIFHCKDQVPYLRPEVLLKVQESTIGGEGPVGLDRAGLKVLASKNDFRSRMLAESERYKEYVHQIEKYRYCDNVEYHEYETVTECPICGVFRQSGKDHFKMKIFTATEFLYPTSYAEKELWQAARKVQKKIKQTTQDILRIESQLRVEAANVIKRWLTFRHLYRLFCRKEHRVKVSFEDFAERKWRVEEKRLYKEQVKHRKLLAELGSFQSSFSSSVENDSICAPKTMMPSLKEILLSNSSILSGSDSISSSESAVSEEVPQVPFKETHEMYKEVVRKLEVKQKSMGGNERHALARRQLDRNRELRKFYLKKCAEGVANPRYPVQSVKPKLANAKRRSKPAQPKKLPSLVASKQSNSSTPQFNNLDSEDNSERSHSQRLHISPAHSRQSNSEHEQQINFENFRVGGSSLASSVHSAAQSKGEGGNTPLSIASDDQSHWERSSVESHWTLRHKSKSNSIASYHALSPHLNSMELDASNSGIKDKRIPISTNSHDENLNSSPRNDSGAQSLRSSMSMRKGSKGRVSLESSQPDEELMSVMSRVPGTMLEEVNQDALEQELPYLKFKSSAHLPPQVAVQKVVLHTGLNRIGHGEECNTRFDVSTVDKVQCIITVERGGISTEDISVNIKDNGSTRGTFILNGSGLFPVPGINTEGYSLKAYDNVVFSRSPKNKTLYELIYEFSFPPQRDFTLTKHSK